MAFVCNRASIILSQSKTKYTTAAMVIEKTTYGGTSPFTVYVWAGGLLSG
jgi:hypothetical protein